MLRGQLHEPLAVRIEPRGRQNVDRVGPFFLRVAEGAREVSQPDIDSLHVQSEALRGLKIESPFGADGTITMRAEDQTVIGYAIGWGTTISKEPYVPEVTGASWESILKLEADWKQRNKYL